MHQFFYCLAFFLFNNLLSDATNTIGVKNLKYIMTDAKQK